MTNISAADVAETREKPAVRSTMLADVVELSALELPEVFDELLLPLLGTELPAVVVLASTAIDIVLLSVDPDAAVVLSVDPDAVVLLVAADIVLLSVDPDAAVVLLVVPDAEVLPVVAEVVPLSVDPDAVLPADDVDVPLPPD